MAKRTVSIFNDVLGPIMCGPSSSHTAGPARIGKMVYQLAGKDFNQAQLYFDQTSAYTNQYKVQGTDRGFAAGLMGWDPDDSRLPESLDIAAQNGLQVSFHVGNYPALINHPNTVRIKLIYNSVLIRDVVGVSTGGGMIEITEIDGFKVCLTGGFYNFLVFTKELDNQALEIFRRQLHSLFNDKITITTTGDGPLYLIIIKNFRQFSKESIDYIKSLPHTQDVIFTEPILPVSIDPFKVSRLKTAAEIIEYGEQNGLALWEIAVIYESYISGWTREQVLAYSEKLLKVMWDNLENEEPHSDRLDCYLAPSAMKVQQAQQTGKLFDLGIMNSSLVFGLKTMETSGYMGRVVAAPTAGSCGVIPGTLFGAGKYAGYPEKDIVRALLCAGMIGVVIAENATFGGEVGGCQAECGSASAMAAAGLVHYLGGDIRTAVAAASCALQNTLGLICDPVAGLVQTPCVSRNIMAIANAFASANIVMGGFDPIIPLDETIETMYQSGKMLPAELKCTCLGGLSVTPTAKKIRNNYLGG